MKKKLSELLENKIRKGKIQKRKCTDLKKRELQNNVKSAGIEKLELE